MTQAGKVFGHRDLVKVLCDLCKEIIELTTVCGDQLMETEQFRNAAAACLAEFVKRPIAPVTTGGDLAGEKKLLEGVKVEVEVEGEEEDETVEADLLVTARDRLTKLRAMDSADVLKKTEKGVLPLKEGARELDEMLEGEDDSGARKKIIKKEYVTRYAFEPFKEALSRFMWEKLELVCIVDHVEDKEKDARAAGRLQEGLLRDYENILLKTIEADRPKKVDGQSAGAAFDDAVAWAQRHLFQTASDEFNELGPVQRSSCAAASPRSSTTPPSSSASGTRRTASCTGSRRRRPRTEKRQKNHLAMLKEGGGALLRAAHPARPRLRPLSPPRPYERLVDEEMALDAADGVFTKVRRATQRARRWVTRQRWAPTSPSCSSCRRPGSSVTRRRRKQWRRPKRAVDPSSSSSGRWRPMRSRMWRRRATG